jgi:REP element-mobilizing transposase RayT
MRSIRARAFALREAKVTQPRIVVRGACILITRRCFGRQFLLHPDPSVVALFLAVLSTAAASYGMAILGAVQMSNHYHIVVHDRHGRYPEFVGWMNAKLTRGINRLRGRVDTMWEARQTSVVELGDDESVLEALAYVHLNPMAAGLVSSPASWPGLVTGPDDLEPPEVMEAVRSGVAVRVPPTHAHLTPSEFAALLRERIKLRARSVLATMKRLGRSFGTVSDVLKVAWQATPSLSLGLEGPGSEGPADEDELLEALRGNLDECEETEPSHAEAARGCDDQNAARRARTDQRTSVGPRRINPTVKSSSSKRRAAMLARIRAFREAYAMALNRFRAGAAVTFPGGTWQLCRTLKLSSGPAPAPAWQLP